MAIRCKSELQHRETCGGNDNESQWYKIVSPQLDDIHLPKVYSNVRQTLGRQPRDDVLEIDVYTMIWRIFLSATLKAAVHLGQDYQENLHTTVKTDFEKVKRLFDISQTSTLDQSQETFARSTFD